MAVLRRDRPTQGGLRSLSAPHHAAEYVSTGADGITGDGDDFGDGDEGFVEESADAIPDSSTADQPHASDYGAVTTLPPAETPEFQPTFATSPQNLKRKASVPDLTPLKKVKPTKDAETDSSPTETYSETSETDLRTTATDYGTTNTDSGTTETATGEETGTQAVGQAVIKNAFFERVLVDLRDEHDMLIDMGEVVISGYTVYMICVAAILSSQDMDTTEAKINESRITKFVTSLLYGLEETEDSNIVIVDDGKALAAIEHLARWREVETLLHSLGDEDVELSKVANHGLHRLQSSDEDDEDDEDSEDGEHGEDEDDNQGGHSNDFKGSIRVVNELAANPAQLVDIEGHGTYTAYDIYYTCSACLAVRQFMEEEEVERCDCMLAEVTDEINVERAFRDGEGFALADRRVVRAFFDLREALPSSADVRDGVYSNECEDAWYAFMDRMRDVVHSNIGSFCMPTYHGRNVELGETASVEDVKVQKADKVQSNGHHLGSFENPDGEDWDSYELCMTRSQGIYIGVGSEVSEGFD